MKNVVRSQLVIKTPLALIHQFKVDNSKNVSSKEGRKPDFL